MKPILVSFFTNDWEYPKHAERLKKECVKFNLDFYIDERPSTADYIQNTAIKPFFIKDCLNKFKRPIIWLDVDALILKSFDLDFSDADILACKHMNSHVKREWAVAFLGFNYTDATMRFIDEWCKQTPRKTDEAAFEDAWLAMGQDLKFKTLPTSFHFVKWSDRIDPPDDIIICHQLSKFEDKLRRKKNGTLDESAN